MAVLKVKNADGTWSIVGVPTDAVKYVSQVLTEAQKAQARENIGASAFNGDYNNLNNIPENILKYTAQTLSDTQKEQARGNIDAAKQATTLTFTLTSAGWNSVSGTYVQTVDLSSLTKVNHVLATVVLNDAVETAKSQQEAWNKISRISLASGSITAYCFEEAPTIDITVRLEVLG